MRRTTAYALALMTLLMLSSTIAAAFDVPDPCKLLTPAEIQRTLGLSDPVSMQPNPSVPSNSTLRFVDLGFGNVGLTWPVIPTPQKNALVCEGRAGDINLGVAVVMTEQAKVSAQQAKAIDNDNRQQNAMAGKAYGNYQELVTYGTEVCATDTVHGADMLGREAQPNERRISELACRANLHDWHVAIVAMPRMARQTMPFSIDQLHKLTNLAVSHLPKDLPVPPPNNATENTGVPAGVLH